MDKKNTNFKKQEDYKLSRSFTRIDKKIQKYLKKRRRNTDIRYRFIKYMTGFVLSIYIGIFVIYLYPSPALAVNVPDFIFENYEDFMKVQTKNSVSDMINGQKLELSYLPDGYTESEIINDNYYYNVTYTNQNKKIIFGQRSNNFINIDNSGFEKIHKNDSIVFSRSNKEVSILVWYGESFQYILAGNENPETMMKIKSEIN